MSNSARTQGRSAPPPPRKPTAVPAGGSLQIGTRSVPVSNLDKVYYPESGFTKGAVLDYYLKIAPLLLPHLKDRPLTLKRYPEGVTGSFFYEKRCPAHRPSWMKTAPVWSERSGGEIGFCLANDLPSLAWVVNTGSLEFHTSLAKARNIDRPTVMAFDLDPGEPANVVDCARVALLLRELLAWMDFDACPKTSGSKGLQIYVPLNTPVTYDQTKALAHAIARLLERDSPDLITSNMKKSLRPGKVFIDWSQNDDHKTTVSVYSLRAREVPSVSIPLRWEEVEAAAQSGKAESLVITAPGALKRAERFGDLFRPVLDLKQRIAPALLRHLENAASRGKSGN